MTAMCLEKFFLGHARREQTSTFQRISILTMNIDTSRALYVMHRVALVFVRMEGGILWYLITGVFHV